MNNNKCKGTCSSCKCKNEEERYYRKAYWLTKDIQRTYFCAVRIKDNIVTEKGFTFDLEDKKELILKNKCESSDEFYSKEKAKTYFNKRCNELYINCSAINLDEYLSEIDKMNGIPLKEVVLPNDFYFKTKHADNEDYIHIHFNEKTRIEKTITTYRNAKHSSHVFSHNIRYYKNENRKTYENLIYNHLNDDNYKQISDSEYYDKVRIKID